MLLDRHDWKSVGRSILGFLKPSTNPPHSTLPLEEANQGQRLQPLWSARIGEANMKEEQFKEEDDWWEKKAKTK